MTEASTPGPSARSGHRTVPVSGVSLVDEFERRPSLGRLVSQRLEVWPIGCGVAVCAPDGRDDESGSGPSDG